MPRSARPMTRQVVELRQMERARGTLWIEVLVCGHQGQSHRDKAKARSMITQRQRRQCMRCLHQF